MAASSPVRDWGRKPISRPVSNNGIDRELPSMSYMSVDDVVAKVLQLGCGAEIAKADVSKAYRNVPVHLDDRWLLGMEWEGTLDGA